MARFVNADDFPLKDFNLLKTVKLAKWDLVGAEVRTDRGKFVSSTWERTVGRRRWRIVIGMYDQLLSFDLVTPSSPLPPSDIQEPIFVRFIADVNLSLMDESLRDQKTVKRSRPTPTPAHPPSRGLKAATQNKPKGIPGIDFPVPAARSPKRNTGRQKSVFLGMKPSSISVLRAIAQSPRHNKVAAGRCKFCGAIAVFGSDTCYSCG
jgi:hypothetical protein